MKAARYVNIAGEGIVDEAALKKIARALKLNITGSYGKRGQNHIKDNLQRWNIAAAQTNTNWVVIVDLNTKADCAPILATEWLSSPHENMVFNVVVREIEAWLLADRANIAGFLSVSRDIIPISPERVLNPKTELVNLARRSRSRNIRETLTKVEGDNVRCGPLYNDKLVEFVINRWDFNRARMNAPSLSRLIEKLEGRVS